MVELKCKKLTDSAKLPSKAHFEDAAYDLFADIPSGHINIRSGETRVIQTGMAIMPPPGWSCDIRGRSGMSSKGKLVAIGLVDSYYTGPWGVILYNSTPETLQINHHDKIAQFTVNKVNDSTLKLVDDFNVPDNVRAASGFGSTGHK